MRRYELQQEGRKEASLSLNMFYFACVHNFFFLHLFCFLTFDVII